VLRKGHNDVKLDPESFDRLVTWVDINAPYYPSYASTYPGHLHGRSPLDNRQLAALGKLTGQNLLKQSHVARVCLTRPELSPCLAGLKQAGDARYAQALAIVQAGKRTLETTRREDMPGAKLVGIEARRQAKYERMARAEAAMRQAIVHGEKRHYRDAAGQ